MLFDSNRIIRNIFALGSGEIIARFVAFLGVAYIARQLGPVEFGTVAFATALCAYLSVAVSAGFNDIGAREVARRPHEASTIAASVLVLRLLLAVVALAVIGIMAWYLDKPPVTKWVVFLTGFSFISLSLDISWVYKGLERNGRVAFALVLAQVLFVGIVLLVVKNPGDVVLVPISRFTGEFVAALLLIVSFFRIGKIKPDFQRGWRIFKDSGFLAITRVFRALIFTFDIVLIGFLLGEREIGLYAAPYRICFVLLALATVIQISYLPALTRTSTQSAGQIADIAGRSLHLSSAVSMPIVVGGMIIAGPLLNVVFGSEYVEGAAAFRLLILSIGFIFIYSSMHNILVVFNRLKLEMWIMATAAGLNIGLNLVLISRYGLVGAAFATALVEGLIVVMGTMAVFRLGVRLDFRPVLRVLMAAGTMAACLLVLGPGHALVIYLGLGSVVYLFAIVVFRGIPQDLWPHLLPVISFAKRSRMK